MSSEIDHPDKFNSEWRAKRLHYIVNKRLLLEQGRIDLPEELSYKEAVRILNFGMFATFMDMALNRDVGVEQARNTLEFLHEMLKMRE